MSIIAGVDEAGRGPVIGPLVICCAWTDRKNEKKLKKVAKKDSKQLSAKQREEALIELRTFCEFRVKEISAQDLNEWMKTLSLNDIEARAMAELIKNHPEWDSMIDMPDRYAQTFRARMERYGAIKFEAQHKADENYPIVAAASICAKVTRDARVEEIKSKTCDFGSGYPSDPKTVAALMNKDQLAMLKPFIRERWQTIERLKQKTLFEGEDKDG